MGKAQLKVTTKTAGLVLAKYSVYKAYVAQVNDAGGIIWSRSGGLLWVRETAGSLLAQDRSLEANRRAAINQQHQSASQVHEGSGRQTRTL